MKDKTIFIIVLLSIALIGGALFFYSPTPKILASTEIQPSKPASTISFIAVGDIMLSRNVAQTIKKQKDPNYPFLKVRDGLNKADIVFANLENPITKGRDIKTGEMTFHANPGSEQSLKDAGITIVSLANNHIPNFGSKGINDTIEALDHVGILHAGAGNDMSAASAPVFMEANGIRIAMLAYNAPDVVPKSYEAGTNHPGTVFLNIPRITTAVKRAKEQADLVIVSMHAGIEYQQKPNAMQTTFAHAAIDAGAEMVIGHHPHVVQTMEEYKGKYIFYSLGNFVFDQMWSQDTREGLALDMTMTKDGVQTVKFLPLQIDDYSQPHSLSAGAQTDRIIKRLHFPTIKEMMLHHDTTL